MTNLRLSDISAARQGLVRLCQDIAYGQVVGTIVKGGDPVLDPPPTILIDVKLDAVADEPRVEAGLADFVLRGEVVRLLSRLDELRDGVVDRIEVRAGLPRRMIIKHEIRGGRP